jgi:GH25 family lysozyme M1 (1,4-beta-N-acetylmuramidase)
MAVQKKVIDISQYQTNVDYTKLAKDVDGVIIRVGYRGYGAAGTLCKDSKFDTHIKGAIDSKIPYGFYFFS